MPVEPSVARRAWLSMEPYHACVYFVPEAPEAYAAAGLKGGWMGYFASRSGAMGAVSAEVVIATFFGFAPPMVRRALPDAWALAAPEDVVRARYAAIDAGLRRILGDLVDGPAVREAAELACAALDGVSPAGRPLGAAWLALDVPEPAAPGPVARRDRPAGVSAATATSGVLVAEGLHPVEAHLLLTRTGRTTDEIVRARRGWERGRLDRRRGPPPRPRPARRATGRSATAAWRCATPSRSAPTRWPSTRGRSSARSASTASSSS